jgi:hypothetical protein
LPSKVARDTPFRQAAPYVGVVGRGAKHAERLRTWKLSKNICPYPASALDRIGEIENPFDRIPFGKSRPASSSMSVLDMFFGAGVAGLFADRFSLTVLFRPSMILLGRGQLNLSLI